MHLKSLLEYGKTFIISCMGQIATSIFSFLSIIFLFDKFGNIEGYTFENVLICFSISFFGFSIAECFFRAFDHFDKMIANGEFDRVLVRPRSIILQVLGLKVEFAKFGRCLASLVIVIWVIIRNPDLLETEKLITLTLMAIGTIIIYASLFVLKAGITFFTTQSLEIMNIFTDGARDLAQYPLNIYHKWVKNFFTYILPLALVNYYPLLYFLGKSNKISYMISPILVAFYLIPAFIVFYQGVKRYSSIGS